MSDSDDPDLAEFLGTQERPRWRRWAKFWVPALILLVLVLALGRCMGAKAQPDYVSSKVEKRALDISVSATGNLRPTNQVEVGSEVSGKIDRVLVDVNDRVTQGQVLAVINTDVIDAQLQRDRAQLGAQQAAVAQAEATLRVDQAQLGRLLEVAKLSGGRVPSKSELEAARGAAERDRAVLRSAQANVAASQAVISSSMTNRGKAVIRAPISGVVLVRKVEPGQTVAAAFNTPTLFVLAEDLSRMQLRVAVDEADVGLVAIGQGASFAVDAYPGRQFPAQVERIDLASNTTASSGTSASSSSSSASGNSVVTYEARLRVENAGGLLRPGMTATARIATQNTGQSLLVPNGALRFRPESDRDARAQVMIGPGMAMDQKQDATIGKGSEQRVYVLQDDGSLKTIAVTTGLSDGRLTAVTSPDLREGMKVVTGLKASAK